MIPAGYISTMRDGQGWTKVRYDSPRSLTHVDNANRLKNGARSMQLNLWLIQIANRWVARLRDSGYLQRWTISERYRCHLILVKAHEEPETDGWRASVHVQFNEGALNFRNVRLPGLTSHCPTKTTAEKQALKEAKL